MNPPHLTVDAGELARLLETRGTLRRQLVLGEARVLDTWVDTETAAVLELSFEQVHPGLVVTGTLTVPWRSLCRRCGVATSGTAVAVVKEMFEPSPRDEETYRLDEDDLDLTELVRDVATLELPLAPLCRIDCAGVCSVCGLDLNFDSCDCDDSVPDPRWAPLAELGSILPDTENEPDSPRRGGVV